MNLLAMMAAGVVSGMLGAMGMGGGGVLMIYLTLIASMEQPLAQGINLIFFLPCAVVAIVIYRKKKLIQFKALLWAVPFGIGGAALGTYLSSLMTGDLLGKLFGGLLVVMGCMQIFAKSPKKGTNKKGPAKRPDSR